MSYIKTFGLFFAISFMFEAIAASEYANRTANEYIAVGALLVACRCYILLCEIRKRMVS